MILDRAQTKALYCRLAPIYGLALFLSRSSATGAYRRRTVRFLDTDESFYFGAAYVAAGSLTPL